MLADLPPAFLAKPVAERGYLNDSAIDRDALLVRNVRVLAEQGATAVEVAATTGLSVVAVDAIAADQGTPPACPICRKPRTRKTRGPRLAKTCGDQTCRTALMARSKIGRRRPLTRTHRKRIGAGVRRYWARQKVAEGDGSLGPVSVARYFRWNEADVGRGRMSYSWVYCDDTEGADPARFDGLWHATPEGAVTEARAYRDREGVDAEIPDEPTFRRVDDRGPTVPR